MDDKTQAERQATRHEDVLRSQLLFWYTALCQAEGSKEKLNCIDQLRNHLDLLSEHISDCEQPLAKGKVVTCLPSL